MVAVSLSGSGGLQALGLIHWDEGQQEEERKRDKYPAGERLMERSKLGRKGWREQDSGSDEGLRSEQEGERKVLELMRDKGLMLS